MHTELHKAKELLEALLGARRILEQRSAAGAAWWEDARKVDSLLHDFLGQKHPGDRELLSFLMRREPRMNIPERIAQGRLDTTGQREDAARDIEAAYYRNAGAVLQAIEIWRFALGANAAQVRSGVVDEATLRGLWRTAAPAPSPSSPGAEPPRARVASGPRPASSGSLAMEFVRIAAGSFWMGAGIGDSDVWDDEKPRHEVWISRPFALGKHPVTQAQWEAVMGRNPSRFKGPDHPVERVRWNDAQEFIDRLNAKEGHNRYRLPTEAEWEYACRAGSTGRYCFGDDAGRLGDYAWYHDNSGDETHPVGQKKPNAWGLYDMHGNVWEWCSDWFGSYSWGAVADPQGAYAGEDRVLRGGSWGSAVRLCRSAFRRHFRPDSRYDSFGFRLALTTGP